jgi:hypothetical protein
VAIAPLMAVAKAEPGSANLFRRRLYLARKN